MIEPDFLVCGFTGKVPGSTEITCTKCGRAMFVAPSGQQQLIGNPALVPICLICAADEMKDTEKFEIVPPQPSQIIELRRELGYTHEQVRTLIHAVTGQDIGEEVSEHEHGLPPEAA